VERRSGINYAVELLFDPEAEAAVLEVWREVRARTGNSVLFDLAGQPHVTLAVHEERDGPQLDRAVRAFLAPATPFLLSSAGTFPGDEGAAFLAPVVTDALLELHRRWHAASPGSNEYYCPGQWVPHCTVGILLEGPALSEALEVARCAVPIRGRFSEIALIAFERHALTPVECLVRVPLKPPSGGARR
jgi:2'-5' RNA ligase